jgi:tetratricopeptide (TPR) repeat protein
MRRLLIAGALLLGACATTGMGGDGGSAPPVPKITTDEEFGEARADYTALPPAGRASWRKALLAYLEPRVDDLLQKGSDDAVEVFRNACSLFEPEELAKPQPDPALAKLGTKLAESYSKRGAEEPVILGLSVAATLDPAQRPRWDEHMKSIMEFEASSGGEARRYGKVIEGLEGTVRLWPSPIVVDKLAQLYFLRHEALLKAIRKGARGGAAEMIEGQDASATHTAYLLAKLYLRVRRTDDAEAALGKVQDQPGDDPLLRGLIKRFKNPSEVKEVIDLAKYFIREDPGDREVAMRICMEGIGKFPKASEPRICAAEMAVSTMAARAPLAIKLLSDAVRIAPQDRAPAETLVKLRFLRLQTRLGDDRAKVDAALPEAQELVRFIEEQEQKLGGKPFEPSAGDVWLEIGQGYYNAGIAKEAEDYLKRAVEKRPSWKAWQYLALIRLKHQKYDEALSLFDRSLAAPTRALQEAIDLRAQVLRDKADALDRAGKTGDAKSARETALEAWTQLLALVQTPNDAARIQLERGKLMYEIGQKRDAVDAFEKAIDFAPQRPETYADVIAFLVPRGHLNESLDAYHRALGRSDITDYVKVYASLWVIDLAEREKEQPDPLAETYLRTVDGTRWFNELARWRSGRMSWQQLIGKADTPAKQAEAYFYQAQRLSSGGKDDEARELWKKVLGTDMMAFFEFDMADYYLRKGAPKKAPPIPPADRPDKKPVGDTI